jgi:hypothetical protein
MKNGKQRLLYSEEEKQAAQSDQRFMQQRRLSWNRQFYYAVKP